MLKQPLALKEIFGRLRQIFIVKEDSSSTDAGKERAIEGRDGALKVFLEEDASQGTVPRTQQLQVQEDILTELKRIRLQLSLLTGEEVSVEEALRER